MGLCFSKPFEGNDPLGHIGSKLPVYVRLLELCRKERWEVYVLTRKTYKGAGVFEGVWRFDRGNFEPVAKPVKIDLVYDRTGGVKFPRDNDSLKVINRRDFKLVAWNKWQAYRMLAKFMPKTYWVGERKNLKKVLPKIKTGWVVLKPYNGMKGIGVFIGPKERALRCRFSKKYPLYIAQEFVDTSGGIQGITGGLHDLRVAIINEKPVWSHVRVPPKGSFKANVAQGGEIMEVDYEMLPDMVRKIVKTVAKKFYKEFNNPQYSLDFGVEKGGAKIFEINDQIGFPKWEMKNREAFLKELVESFKRGLQAKV